MKSFRRERTPEELAQERRAERLLAFLNWWSTAGVLVLILVALASGGVFLISKEFGLPFWVLWAAMIMGIASSTAIVFGNFFKNKVAEYCTLTVMNCYIPGYWDGGGTDSSSTDCGDFGSDFGGDSGGDCGD